MTFEFTISPRQMIVVAVILILVFQIFINFVVREITKDNERALRDRRKLEAEIRLSDKNKRRMNGSDRRPPKAVRLKKTPDLQKQETE